MSQRVDDFEEGKAPPRKSSITSTAYSRRISWSADLRSAHALPPSARLTTHEPDGALRQAHGSDPRSGHAAPEGPLIGNVDNCTVGWYKDTRCGLSFDCQFSRRTASRLLRRECPVAEYSIRFGGSSLPKASDDRRCDDRSGPAGAAEQSFREAAWQFGRVAFDSRQQAMASDLSMG